ncbi:hypothetical protein C1H46_029850 [Malus baccata]|uniref:Uncharacterized protein n=1 Tax=Malus baccata TaxID=106549 RepID=A0A540LDN4_MALBA|nr:hypothetical protein C1H46_029850 [Malus baccata]
MPQFAAQKPPSSNLNLVGFTLRGDSDYSAHAHVSPSREVLRDMAKEEWGIDGYGRMKRLIWLRSPGNMMRRVVADQVRAMWRSMWRWREGWTII